MKKTILSVFCFVMIAVLLTASVSATVTISAVSAAPDPAEYGIDDVTFRADIVSDDPLLSDITLTIEGTDYTPSPISGNTYGLTLPASTFHLESNSYIFSATDAGGIPSSSSTEAFIVLDTTEPVINDHSIPRGVCYGDHISVFANVTDNYDDPVSYVAVNINGLDYSLSELLDNYFTDADAIDSTLFGGLTTLVANMYVEDSEGNYAYTGAQSIDIYDCVEPTISSVAEYYDPVEYGDTITITADVTDDISNIATVKLTIGTTEYDMMNIAGDTYSVDINTVSDLGALGTYTYTITATDESELENEATPVTGSFEVVDTTPPVITLLGSEPVTVEVGSTYTDAGATAYDNYDGDLTSSIITVNPVDTNVLGTYIVTYDVTDSSGNPAVQVTRTVNVVDTTLPVITLLGSDPVTVEVGSTYTDAGATAYDNYDGDLTASIITVNPVDTNVLGTYIVTYDVTDSEGNPAVQVTRTVNVADTTAPSIDSYEVSPTDTPEIGDSVTIIATVTDNDAISSVEVDVEGTVYTMANTGGDTYESSTINTATLGLGVQTYTITATDNSGLTDEESDIFVVIDSVDPTINSMSDAPDPVEFGADVTFTADATDDNGIDTVALEIDGTSYTMDYDSSTGIYTFVLDSEVLSVATFSYSVTATDTFGNSVTDDSGSLTVVDSGEPIITVLGDNPATVEGGSTYTDAGATAEDAVDGTLAVTTTGSVDTMTVGTYIITYTATDSAGNSATATRTVYVVDTTAPVITILGDNPAYAELGSTYTDAGATALDIIDGDLTASIVTTGTVDTGVEGTYTITYSVSDSEGNPATATRTVEVADTTNPTLGTVTLSQNPVDQGAPLVFSVDATDSNGIDSVTLTVTGVITDEQMTNTAGDTYEYTLDTTGLALGTYSYVITATDNYGNTATQSGTFRVTIVSPITVEIRADKTSGEEELDVSFTAAVEGGIGKLDYEWNFGDGNTNANMYTRHTFTSDGTFTVTLTVEDDYGNVGTDTVVITVAEEGQSNEPRNNIQLTGISFDNDVVGAGESLVAEVQIENIGNDDLEDVSLTLFIEELGIWTRTTGIDVDEGDSVEKTAVLDIPHDVEPGVYDVRIVVSNDDMKRVKHRDIEII